MSDRSFYGHIIQGGFLFVNGSGSGQQNYNILVRALQCFTAFGAANAMPEVDSWRAGQQVYKKRER